MYADIACHANLRGAFVYRNEPEWTELPEWTTGMDFYMRF